MLSEPSTCPAWWFSGGPALTAGPSEPPIRQTSVPHRRPPRGVSLGDFTAISRNCEMFPGAEHAIGGNSDFLFYIFPLPVADDQDSSGSETDLGRRQPLCLQCKIGITDSETFGPVASSWLWPHPQRNKNSLCPRNAIWNGAVSPAPSIWPPWKRLSVRGGKKYNNNAKFQLPLCYRADHRK